MPDASDILAAYSGAFAGDPGPPEPPDELAHNGNHAGEWSPNGQPALDDETAIEWRMQKLRIDREAKRRLDAEERPPTEPPPVRSLDTLLAEPDSAPTPFVVDQLAPSNSRVMLSAQYKAGKTTLRDNLVRSLADSQLFLDRFEIHRPPNRIVLIDTELDDDTLRRWLREQNITNRAAVVDVIGLRGKVSALDLIDDRTRTYWASRLRDLGCDYLILDCLRPVLDSLGLDEARDGGRFLVGFDALLNEAGTRAACVVHHMGHTGERSRGDSRFQDWPDAIWRLVRESDEPGSARFFSAYGRDVDVHEGRLTFDPGTRHLAYIDGSRKDSKTEAATPDVMAVLAEHAQEGGQGLSGRQIESAVAASEHSRNAIREALRASIHRGLVVVVDGPRRSKLHRIANPCSRCGQPLTAGQDGQHLECGANS